MAIVATDWTVTRTDGNIRYIGNDHAGGSPSYATVIEFHRWLQDLADDAVSVGDDELDITDEDPSARSTDNIITLLGNYQIDAQASEHLYDGSIIQNGGDDIYDGIVNFGNTDVQIQIIQNGAVLADDWWNFAGGGLNASAAQGISHRFMLPTRVGGTDTDGRRLIGVTREFSKTFSEFSINGTARGNNVLALSNADDLNNQTTGSTVSGLTITNTTEGYIGIDVDNNGADEFYYSEWNLNTPTNSINDFYEYAKWLTRDGSTDTLYGLSGELFRGITHQIPLSARTGTFAAFEAVNWAGGTGQMLAVDSPTAGTAMWIQLLTGAAPTAGQTITAPGSSATADVDVAGLVSRTLSEPFVGQSTGSAIIGAYGLGIETDDLTNSDSLFDLTNTQINPPNNVSFTVAGLVDTEDRVLVAPWDGVSTDAEGNPAIQQDQLGLQTSLTTDNITAVAIDQAVPSDTPNSGTIRVVDDNGFDRRLEYSATTASGFTITSTDGQEDFAGTGATAGNDVYITYIDQLASNTGGTETFTGVYSTDRDLVIIVRDGGVTPIKQFITSGTFSSSNTTITAIRTSDL
tara:strand:+ start:15339 stop:17063 length:1725 start_codon:yes stop_codon:yes gene_type:complete